MGFRINGGARALAGGRNVRCIIGDLVEGVGAYLRGCDRLPAIR